MGGRRDGLVGSVSVPLCDLQDGLMHDLWLNLRPNANLPAPRNAAEQRSMNLDKWAQHSELGMWGSVHLVIQKTKKPHVRVPCRVVSCRAVCGLHAMCCACAVAKLMLARVLCSWEC
jgi:hypothetical protein